MVGSLRICSCDSVYCRWSMLILFCLILFVLPSVSAGEQDLHERLILYSSPGNSTGNSSVLNSRDFHYKMSAEPETDLIRNELCSSGVSLVQRRSYKRTGTIPFRMIESKVNRFMIFKGCFRNFPLNRIIGQHIFLIGLRYPDELFHNLRWVKASIHRLNQRLKPIPSSRFYYGV